LIRLICLTLSLTAGLLAWLPADTVAIPLTIVNTIGGDDGDVFLHEPSDIVPADDGTFYMLNAGDCQVLHMNHSWDTLNIFGKCGEGPGEFTNPTGMVIYKGQIWVFEQARMTVYEADGTYVRTVLPGTQYAAPIVLDGRIIARLGSGDRTAAYLDDEGVIAEYLGLDCPVDFFEGFKACRNIQILPHEDGQCLMLNLVDGNAHLIGEDGYPVWSRSLIKTEDDSKMSTSDDGESVSMTLTLAMGMGCRDAKGRYWITNLPEDETDLMEITIFEKDLETVVTSFFLPDGIFCWQMFQAPNGQMYLVSTSESTIYVCDVATDL
jgi:hypothetical protein